MTDVCFFLVASKLLLKLIHQNVQHQSALQLRLKRISSSGCQAQFVTQIEGKYVIEIINLSFRSTRHLIVNLDIKSNGFRLGKRAKLPPVIIDFRSTCNNYFSFFEKEQIDFGTFSPRPLSERNPLE